MTFSTSTNVASADNGKIEWYIKVLNLLFLLLKQLFC